jgi:hypothetical protein
MSVLQSLRARFELSVAVLVAAMIFTAVNLIDGGLRVLQLQWLARIAETFELSDDLLGAIGKTVEIMQVIVMAAVLAAAYLMIGSLLRNGFRSILNVWRLTRYNRLRVFALFLLLSLLAAALNAVAAPAISWLLRPAYSRRSATSSIRWLALLVRIRSARWRVGRMFSCRLTRLMRDQIPLAVLTASSSESFE